MVVNGENNSSYEIESEGTEENMDNCWWGRQGWNWDMAPRRQKSQFLPLGEEQSLRKPRKNLS
jgi:hypothetical protein